MSLILKPNMILAGNESQNKISNEEVASKTLECLTKSVPKEGFNSSDGLNDKNLNEFFNPNVSKLSL